MLTQLALVESWKTYRVQTQRISGAREIYTPLLTIHKSKSTQQYIYTEIVYDCFTHFRFLFLISLLSVLNSQCTWSTKGRYNIYVLFFFLTVSSLIFFIYFFFFDIVLFARMIELNSRDHSLYIYNIYARKSEISQVMYTKNPEEV